MSPPTSVHHHSFVIEREFTSPPSLVFFAHADAAAKRAWFSGPADWDRHPGEFDFRVGGRETSTGGPPGGFVSLFDGRYMDIVPDRRIIFAFSMFVDGKLITTSLATVEFQPSDYGTRLLYTEQIAFLDGSDHLPQRIEGSEAMFDALEAWLGKS